MPIPISRLENLISVVAESQHKLTTLNTFSQVYLDKLIEITRERASETRERASAASDQQLRETLDAIFLAAERFCAFIKETAQLSRESELILLEEQMRQKLNKSKNKYMKAYMAQRRAAGVETLKESEGET